MVLLAPGQNPSVVVGAPLFEEFIFRDRSLSDFVVVPALFRQCWKARRSLRWFPHGSVTSGFRLGIATALSFEIATTPSPSSGTAGFAWVSGQLIGTPSL